MRRVELSWLTIGIGVITLLLLGAAGAYLWVPRPNATTSVRSNGRDVVPSAIGSGPLPDVAITLSDDAVKKAGVVISPVTMSDSRGSIRLTGTVQPNAYREVVVAPLVSGRVTRVLAMLGDRVGRNAPVVEIYSQDLADAQTRYLSMRADFQAIEQEIVRTDRLAEIGAASQQERERIHAEHLRHATEVESARTRLQLLGMTPEQIAGLTGSGQVAATTTVVSPIAGVVTARNVNPGTTVDSSTPLVTVVDLSTVWVIGDLYERDFARVSVGMPATVTTTGFPGQELMGKVAYIDPQVRAETRTANVRVEVPNAGQQLRLGMYAEVQVEVAATNGGSILVPRSAIQNVADRTVIYIADPGQQGRFIEREVRLGEVSGDKVAVLSGVHNDDRVVIAGSFSLRAEGDRLGLRASAISTTAAQR